MEAITCKNCKQPIRLVSKDTETHISADELKAYLDEHAWIHDDGYFSCHVPETMRNSGHYAEPGLGYAVCIWNVITKRIDWMGQGQKVGSKEAQYAGQDYHVIPVKDRANVTLGAHELTRDCPCHVRVLLEYVRPIVRHNEKVN
jgi:hypothetical protein